MPESDPTDGRFIAPVELRLANRFVSQFHGHSPRVVGHKISLGYWEGPFLMGVAILGRPVARRSDNGSTLEVTRNCVQVRGQGVARDLYEAAAYWAWQEGAARIQTYTRPVEPAKSLQAAKWRKAVRSSGTGGRRPGRRAFSGPKVRWERVLRD